MFFKSRAQSIIEYIMLFMIVVAAIALSHKYVYRAMNARLKQIQEELSHKNQYASVTVPAVPPIVSHPPQPWIAKTTSWYMTNGDDRDNNHDEAWCPDGEVATGYKEVGSDEVHCVKVEFTSPTNPNEKLCTRTTGGYTLTGDKRGKGSNEAVCWDGDVAIGYSDIGNDYVHCVKLAVTTCTEPPQPRNDLCITTSGWHMTSQGGGYSEAVCPNGEVMVGYKDSGNDEVHCAKLVVTPCG